MMSAKLSAFIVVATMACLAAFVEAEFHCKFDKAIRTELVETKKYLDECYTETTGKKAPSDPSQYNKLEKDVKTQVLVCASQKNGSVGEDGTTVNIDLLLERIQSTKQTPETKEQLTEGTQECYNAHEANPDIATFLDCNQGVFVKVCM